LPRGVPESQWLAISVLAAAAVAIVLTVVVGPWGLRGGRLLITLLACVPVVVLRRWPLLALRGAARLAGQHLGFVNPAIYTIARSPAYHHAFHDAINGDNSVIWPTGGFTGYTAGPGWDPVTGWGSPNAQYLVPVLARAACHGSAGS
jgi:hypothetical protein